MSGLSIVIPAYNEETNVQNAVVKISYIAQDLGLDYEIILVNDGSQDRTGEIGGQLAKTIPHFRLVSHYPNRGYGGALKAGFTAAFKELIVFIPADNQFDFNEVDKLLALTGDADIVCGYRVKRQDPLSRWINAFGWNTLVRLLFGYLSRDIDCGFKLFRRAILDEVKLVSNGAMVDTELLAGAKARGYRIAEVPVTHLPRISGEATGAHPKVILKAFQDLIEFRMRLNRELAESNKHGDAAAHIH